LEGDPGATRGAGGWCQLHSAGIVARTRARAAPCRTAAPAPVSAISPERSEPCRAARGGRPAPVDFFWWWLGRCCPRTSGVSPTGHQVIFVAGLFGARTATGTGRIGSRASGDVRSSWTTELVGRALARVGLIAIV